MKERLSVCSYIDFGVETGLCVRWHSRGDVDGGCASGTFSPSAVSFIFQHD